MVTRRQEEPLRIEPVRTREISRMHTHGPGRICATQGCETRLSIYNEGRHCWVHGENQISIGAPVGRPRREHSMEQIADGIWARSA
jgi:hypothetical protein